MVALGVPGGGVLLLFRRGGSSQPSPTPGGTIPPHDGQGQLHLAFAMPIGELAAWEQHLRAAGVALEAASPGRVAAPACIFAIPTITRWKSQPLACGRVSEAAA